MLLQAVQLAKELLDGLPSAINDACDIIFSDVEAALSASEALNNAIHFLEDDTGLQLSSRFIFIMSPRTSQV